MSDSSSVPRIITMTTIECDDKGNSFFGSRSVTLRSKGDIGSLSDLMPTSGMYLRYTPGDYDFDWHCAPRKQYIINFDAEVEVTVTSGEKRVLKAGEIFYVADTTGTGHKSRSLDGKPRFSAFIPEAVDHISLTVPSKRRAKKRRLHIDRAEFGVSVNPKLYFPSTAPLPATGPTDIDPDGGESKDDRPDGGQTGSDRAVTTDTVQVASGEEGDDDTHNLHTTTREQGLVRAGGQGQHTQGQEDGEDDTNTHHVADTHSSATDHRGRGEEAEGDVGTREALGEDKRDGDGDDDDDGAAEQLGRIEADTVASPE